MIPALFDLANVFVLPFWALMILLPNWGISKKVMESYLPFVALAGVYIYFFVYSVGAMSPESAQSLLNPKVADIARFFADEAIAATGWAHFLTLDLFVGRWIYWEGQKTGVWTVHSLILCLFAGPIGLLSHILTVWITKGLFSSSKEETPSTSVTSN